METLFLDGRDYRDASELHAALKRLLRLPAWYGGNADALYDCLSERRERVNLCVLHFGSGETEQALRLCARVVADAGGEVREA